MPGCGRHLNRAAHLPDHFSHDVESYAAAGEVGDDPFHRESGQKQELQQLGITQRGSRGSVNEVALDDGLAQSLQIDAAAVVGNDDVKRARTMTGLEPDDALDGLPGGAAVIGPFNAVVDGVSKQVAERRVELRENVSIDPRRLAGNFQPGLFAERARNVADHAGQALNPVGERPHAARDRLVIEPTRQIHCPAIEYFELMQPLPEGVLAF